MLCIFLLRDVFESLKCCLDLWLSSLLDCIHFCVFPLLEKLSNQARQHLDRSRQITIYQDLWTSFLDSSYCIFDPSKLSGICLDRFSIHRESFCLPIASQQLFDPSRHFCHRQIFYSTSTDLFVEN